MDTAPRNSEPEPDPPGHDFACPLCEYSLRGLATPRCPECGFAFKWEELIDADRRKHDYLFEQGKGRNFVTFFKTMFFSQLPWKFWTDLTPAMPVRRGRLVLYWALSSLILVIIAGALPAGRVVEIAIDNDQQRSNYRPVPGRPGLFQWGPETITESRLQHLFPRPWDQPFVDDLQVKFDWNYTRSLGLPMTDFYFTGPAVVLAWPWLTLATLPIFFVSMRRAKIKFAHVLRTVIYGGDHVIPVLLVGLFVQVINPEPAVGVQTVAVMVACAIFTTVKIGFAFSRYLRVHLSVWTVLASQAIVLISVFLWLSFQRRYASSLF